jgi:hypothetical protein
MKLRYKYQAEQLLLLKEKIIAMIEHYNCELKEHVLSSDNYEWCHLLICELEDILDSMIFHEGLLNEAPL